MKYKLITVSLFVVTNVNAQFLGENVRSGIPSWDNAFIKAGGKFEELQKSNGIFLGENVRSGIPSWDNAFIKAGGKFEEPKTNFGNKSLDKK